MAREVARFRGCVAVVTGAGSGIGREAALQLAAEGAVVCLTDLDEPEARQTADRIGQSSASHAVYQLDVRSESEWEAVIEEVVASHGRLDLIVNCAGITAAAAIDEMSYSEWRRVFAVNLDGAFLATKHGIRVMRASGGSIVHVSSACGVKAVAGACAYSASKAAVCMLSKAAAKECRDKNIPVRVNTASLAELVEKTGSEAAAFKSLESDTPGGRFAEPADIVAAILFLASDESRLINGIDLLVDGGYVL